MLRNPCILGGHNAKRREKIRIRCLTPTFSGDPLHCVRTARYFYTRFPLKRPQAHPFQRPLNFGHANYRS